MKIQICPHTRARTHKKGIGAALFTRNDLHLQKTTYLPKDFLQEQVPLGPYSSNHGPPIREAAPGTL